MKQRIILLLLVTSQLSVQILCNYPFSNSVICQSSDNTNYSFGFSPPPYTDWNRTYGGSDSENANDIVQTNDGGYILAGTTWHWSSNEPDFSLLKTDADGYMQWNRTYGGSRWDNAYSIIQTLDGGYAVAGRTNSIGAGDWDFWVVKTDANGNIP